MRMRRLWMLGFIFVSLLIMAGCSIHLAKIREVDLPTKEALRIKWRNYNTYCLGNYAMLFELKGYKTVQKEDDWRKVTNDQMAFSCASFLIYSSPVMQLLGENDETFGYLIYNFHDGVSALIIDPSTIRLFYHVHPKGP
ncbi:MAG: hypothetical protein ACM3KE_20145 [Hyphomicrobiales bacterium]